MGRIRVRDNKRVTDIVSHHIIILWAGLGHWTAALDGDKHWRTSGNETAKECAGRILTSTDSVVIALEWLA